MYFWLGRTGKIYSAHIFEWWRYGIADAQSPLLALFPLRISSPHFWSSSSSSSSQNRILMTKSLVLFWNKAKECNFCFFNQMLGKPCKLIVVTFVMTNHRQTLRKAGGYKSITAIKGSEKLNLRTKRHILCLIIFKRTLFKIETQENT